MTVEEYFADKVERTIQFYESRLKKINDAYLAEVARVVRRQFKDDPAWAGYFDVHPSHIAEELRDIRFLIAQGKIVEADYALDRFRIELVERHLRHRYLSAGMATSRGGKKSAANKWGGADGRAHEMHRMWQEQRTRGDSRGEADEAVARAFKVSTRTVRTARTKIGKQLSVSN